eukprot:836211-Prorocentrum_minimum.AAC.1
MSCCRQLLVHPKTQGAQYTKTVASGVISKGFRKVSGVMLDMAVGLKLLDKVEQKPTSANGGPTALLVHKICLEALSPEELTAFQRKLAYLGVMQSKYEQMYFTIAEDETLAD